MVQSSAVIAIRDELRHAFQKLRDSHTVEQYAVFGSGGHGGKRLRSGHGDSVNSGQPVLAKKAIDRLPRAMVTSGCFASQAGR